MADCQACGASVYQLSTISYRLFSRHSQEFLPNTQLRVLREKDLGDKDLVRRQVARCDCFVILNPLLRVDQNSGGVFPGWVVVATPFLGIFFWNHLLNFNPMVGRYIDGYTSRRLVW